MGNAFFVLANAQGALSVAVVLSSLYPVTTILLARIILHERLRGGQLVGVAAALAGVVLIAI
jgi:drug/metabolite transporter (DMT)-like permease